MASTIIQRPTRQINANFLSRWTAGHNPVIYKFERRDYDIIEIANYTGDQLRVKVSGNDIFSELNIGDQIYIKSGQYDALYTIDSFFDLTTYTTIYITGDYIATAFGGFVNLVSGRQNYRIIAQVKEVGSNKLLGQKESAPFSNGIAKLDCKRILEAYFKSQVNFSYQVNNDANTLASVKFYVSYSEAWVGGSTVEINDTLNPVYSTNSAKQIGDINGQNMAEYIPVPLYNEAKFLSKFTKPRMWVDYPFSLSFVFSEELSGFNINAVFDHFNLNNQNNGTESNALDISKIEQINFLKVDNAYAETVEEVEVYLETGDTSPEQYVYEGYVNQGYVAKV